MRRTEDCLVVAVTFPVAALGRGGEGKDGGSLAALHLVMEEVGVWVLGLLWLLESLLYLWLVLKKMALRIGSVYGLGQLDGDPCCHSGLVLKILILDLGLSILVECGPFDQTQPSNKAILIILGGYLRFHHKLLLGGWLERLFSCLLKQERYRHFLVVV